jgi:Spy/CpxP family protein refolding chaperone
MRFVLLAIFLATHLVPAVAFAQTAEHNAACKVDYKNFCTGVMPGGGRLIQGLSKHVNDLTPECQKVVKANSGG